MEKTLKTAPNNLVEKVALLHFRDGSVLFARSKTTRQAYSLGGKPNPGETLHDALVRECREEAGIEIIPESIEFYHVFEGPCHGYVEGTKLRMHCFTARFRGEPAVQSGDNVEELVYLSGKDLGKGATTVMGDQMLAHFLKQGLISPP